MTFRPFSVKGNLKVTHDEVTTVYLNLTQENKLGHRCCSVSHCYSRDDVRIDQVMTATGTLGCPNPLILPWKSLIHRKTALCFTSVSIT